MSTVEESVAQLKAQFEAAVAEIRSASAKTAQANLQARCTHPCVFCGKEEPWGDKKEGASASSTS